MTRTTYTEIHLVVRQVTVEKSDEEPAAPVAPTLRPPVKARALSQRSLRLVGSR